MRISKALLVAAGALMASFSVAQANEVSPCDSSGVLSTIKSRFHHQSHEVHHDRLRIETYSKVHQHRFEASGKHSTIARRYCMATAHVSNGKKYSVRYFIEGGMGFASMGDNVEFCVSGFDRWNVYNSYCRVAR